MNLLQHGDDDALPMPDRVLSALESIAEVSIHAPASRVLRGGNSFDNYMFCSSVHRDSTKPVNRRSDFGFRLALSPE
jgi:formylglycine-generating enzyme required for sulfatase activity